MARLAADDSSDVAAAGRVLRQHDIAGSKAADRAITGFDFDLTEKSNDVLPFGYGMIITQMICRRAAKLDSVRRLQF